MRHAFTLIELLIAVTIIGIMTAIAIPRIRTTMDSMAVEAATRDVTNAFALARLAALRDQGAELVIDSLSVTLRTRGRTIYTRDIVHTHAVTMRTNVPLVRYAATGLAAGFSNGSIQLTRHHAADTVVISRLGRVRR